jgi:hypothetical protein
MGLGWGRLAAVVLLVAPSGAPAQAPADACALMGRDEFQALTGKQEFTDPEGMPFGGGTVCGFNNGQILLWTGDDAPQAFDRLLASFGEQDLARTPVEGLGEGAFAIFYHPESEYQDHGAGVVFGAGPPTVAVMVYAEDGEPPEAALPQAMAVAQAVAGRLE